MNDALANPRRTKIVSWPEPRPMDADSEHPAESEAKDDLAVR